MHLSHIPKCTIQYKSVHFFLIWMVNYGIWDRSIVGCPVQAYFLRIGLWSLIMELRFFYKTTRYQSPLVLHIYMSQWTRSALIEVMAYRLFVSSHYLNQYWFIFIGLLWANVSVILFIKQHSSFMKISKCFWNCRLQKMAILFKDMR